MHFNIADLFESLADAIGDREALVCGERRYTYAQLDARANRVAHWMKSRGIEAGDHVGLHLYNGGEFIEILLGCFKVRAVPININYRYVSEELRYMFDNARLKLLFHQRELSRVVAEAAQGQETLGTFVALEDGSAEPLDVSGSEAYEEAIAHAPETRDFPERSGDDLYIVYTGGTTGMPRGVMWRQEDVFFAGLQGGNPGGKPISAPEELAANAAKKAMGMTFLPLAPFIHGAAQWAALIAMFGGGRTVVIPGKQFQPRRAWELVEQEKVNTLTMVGDAMARPLVDAHDGSFETRSLFVLASAGAILSDSVKDDLKEKLGSVMIMNSFGSSEAGHTGHALPGRDRGVDGRVSFTMDPTTTVLGEDNRPIEPGSGVVGKLARTGRLPLGYYGDAEKTAATFKQIDGKRWVLPGDFATIEADGRITLFGRGAVCINSGGEKIFPEEVESALKAHPAVMDVLVVGLPDERWGQRVAAVVQLRQGRSASFEELDTYTRSKVAGYKSPREIFLCEEVARQPSGKPDYKWALSHAQNTPAHA